MVFGYLLVLFILNGEFVSGYFNESKLDTLQDFTNQKLPRFLTFHTEENGDVEVELEFRVPFLSVPVKRAMDTMHTMGWHSGDIPSANVNLAALGLGGAVIIGSVIAVPIISALFSKKETPHYGENKHRRRDDDISYMMQTTEKLLEEYNIDSSKCLKRIICQVIKSANINLQNGNPGSYDLMISGLSRNSIFNNLIQHTSFQQAIDSALNNDNCLSKFRDCNVKPRTIHRIVDQISNLFSKSAYL